MLGDSETITIKLVAAEGANDDWALYVAPAEWADRVAKENGTKLPEAVARALARAGLGLFERDWSVLTYRP